MKSWHYVGGSADMKPVPSLDIAMSTLMQNVAIQPMRDSDQCQVCGDTVAGRYFGAYVCMPCKIFFLRNHDKGSSLSCSGLRAHGNCIINKNTRTNCSSCRYKRCLQAGMAKKERPEVVEPLQGQKLCMVCSDIANGIHFGVVSCEGCKKFFRRSLGEQEKYKCRGTKPCAINPRSRNTCRYCRYQKCLRVGMSPDVGRKDSRRLSTEQDKTDSMGSLSPNSNCASKNTQLSGANGQPVLRADFQTKASEYRQNLQDQNFQPDFGVSAVSDPRNGRYPNLSNRFNEATNPENAKIPPLVANYPSYGHAVYNEPHSSPLNDQSIPSSFDMLGYNTLNRLTHHNASSTSQTNIPSNGAFNQLFHQQLQHTLNHHQIESSRKTNGIINGNCSLSPAKSFCSTDEDMERLSDSSPLNLTGVIIKSEYIPNDVLKRRSEQRDDNLLACDMSNDCKRMKQCAGMVHEIKEEETGFSSCRFAEIQRKRQAQANSQDEVKKALSNLCSKAQHERVVKATAEAHGYIGPLSPEILKILENVELEDHEQKVAYAPIMKECISVVIPVDFTVTVIKKTAQWFAEKGDVDSSAWAMKLSNIQNVRNLEVGRTLLDEMLKKLQVEENAKEVLALNAFFRDMYIFTDLSINHFNSTAMESDMIALFARQLRSSKMTYVSEKTVSSSSTETSGRGEPYESECNVGNEQNHVNGRIKHKSSETKNEQEKTPNNDHSGNRPPQSGNNLAGLVQKYSGCHSPEQKYLILKNMASNFYSLDYWMKPQVFVDLVDLTDESKQIIRTVARSLQQHAFGLLWDRLMLLQMYKEDEAGPADLQGSLVGYLDKQASAMAGFVSKLPGWTKLETADQLYILYKAMPLRIVAMILYWYISAEKLFHPIGWSWYQFPWCEFLESLLTLCAEFHAMEVDLIEGALLLVLCGIAADTPAVQNPEVVTEVRQPYLKAFTAYLQKKHGIEKGNRQLLLLFTYVPRIRLLYAWFGAIWQNIILKSKSDTTK